MPASTASRRFILGSLLAGRYRILDVIGRGSIGTVLRVSDLELDKEIFALKVLHHHLSTEEEAFLRFQKEVLLARQLAHSNIVRVFDFDGIEAENLYYISMECIEGPNLRQYIDTHKGRRLPLEDAVRILNNLLSALVFAHQKGIIHRDVKPENILLTGAGQAKLGDFGAAHSFEASLGLTRTGELLGTPLYMAPEQFRCEKPSPRSDIYSAGILAYEMICGSPPFEDQNWMTLAKQHAEAELPRQPLSDADAPLWFVQFIERCAKKKPEERFSSAGEMLEFLRSNAAETLARRSTVTMQKAFSRHYPRLYFTRGQRLAIVLMIVIPYLIATPWITLQDKRLHTLLERIIRIERSTATELPWLKKAFLFEHRSPFVEAHVVQAAAEEDERNLLALVRSGTDVNIRDAKGDAAIHTAVKHRSLVIVSALEKLHADMNLADASGDRPLHRAVRENAEEMAISLLEKRADPDLRDRDGNTAILAALKTGNIRLFDIILRRAKKRLDCNLRDRSGLAPLHVAVMQRSAAAVQALIECGAYPDMADRKGRTALMLACGLPHEERQSILQILLAACGDVRARDYSGRTALDYARAAGVEQEVQRLYLRSRDCRFEEPIEPVEPDAED